MERPIDRMVRGGTTHFGDGPFPHFGLKEKRLVAGAAPKSKDGL